MTDSYARLAAILWHLTSEDLDALLQSGESLAVARFNSYWMSPPTGNTD